MGFLKSSNITYAGGRYAFAVFCLVFIAFVVYVYICRYMHRRHIRKLGTFAPQVKTYLPLGLDVPFRASAGYLSHQAIKSWEDWFAETEASKTGNYNIEVLLFRRLRVILTADPVNIMAIMKDQFSDYNKGEAYRHEWREVLGRSIFVFDGAEWAHVRALLRPYFRRERTANLARTERATQNLFRHLGNGDGRKVDFRALMRCWSLDTSMDFLTNLSPELLRKDNPAYQDAFDYVQYYQGLRFRAGPLMVFLPKGKFYKMLKITEDFLDPYIQKALSFTAEELQVTDKNADTALHALARYTRNTRIMRDELMGATLASRDTTSNTLSWLFLELSRRPDIQTRIRDEVRTSLARAGLTLPTYEFIQRMTLVNQILKETLRLYPVVAFSEKTAIHDTTLPRGGGPDGTQPVGVPAGTHIVFSSMIMHRRPDLYPPMSKEYPYEPAEWHPERWDNWMPDDGSYIPFQRGPRMCLAHQHVMIEMGYLICRLFMEYDRVVDCGNEGVKLDIATNLMPTPGVYVGFAKGEKSETCA